MSQSGWRLALGSRSPRDDQIHAFHQSNNFCECGVLINCTIDMTSNSSSQGTVQRKEPSDRDTLPREKLPQSLQDLVDDEETLLERIYDGKYVARMSFLSNVFPHHCSISPDTL